MNNKLIQFGYPRKTETDQKRQQTDHEFDVNYDFYGETLPT